MADAPFTSVTLVASMPAVVGGDGVHWAFGTAVGPANYKSTGSIIDMSDIFKSTCQGMFAWVDNAAIRMLYVPAGSYATATGALFMDDNAGTEIGAVDESSTCAVTHWIAWGTDA